MARAHLRKGAPPASPGATGPTVLAPLLITLATPFQAGGGGSFGGGGGGGSFGGGGGGDGEGLLYLLFWLIRLAIEYPPIGVPVLIVAAVVFFKGSRRGWWKHQERTIQRATPRRRERASAVSADRLKKSDPDFDTGRFLERVEAAFVKAQDAWCAQDLEPLRPFVSDGVFERFSLQIEEQEQDGWRQGMEGLTQGPLTLAHIENGEHFDVVTVRIPFRAQIHRLGLADGKKIAGSQLPRDSFCECWSFVRKRGAKSISGEGLIEGKCPNCGAALEMNQSARCSYCECLARSGQFDWVLAEITQASEWRPEDEGRVPGLAAYQPGDPGMNVQMLEDRASVAFWRKCAADRAGKIDSLTRVADDELCRTYAERLTASEDGRRSCAADCAVGSVRTLAVLAGDDRDRALVEIVWDGLRAVTEGSGERRLKEPRALHRTIFVFAREAGRTTRLDGAFTTAHCSGCGAHDPGGTDPDCAHCGAPRRGDASTWLLTRIAEKGSPEGRELLAEVDRAERAPASRPEGSASSPGSAGLITWAASLVLADGTVDERERRALHSLAESGEVPPERVEALLADPPTNGAVPVPTDEVERRSWLRSLIEIGLADGGLSGSERRLLHHAAVRLQVPRRDLQAMIRESRSVLYRESKVAPRASR